jgi:broad-specificity NMP kinase
MPYIKPEIRERFQHFVRVIEEPCPPVSAGELNYIITRLVAHFIGTPSYGSINTAIGVLECAKLELYRRLAAPYEDKKISENGDIPEYKDNQ